MTKVGSDDKTCDRFYGSDLDNFEGKIFFLIKSLTVTLRIPILTGDEVKSVAQVLI